MRCTELRSIGSCALALALAGCVERGVGLDDSAEDSESGETDAGEGETDAGEGETDTGEGETDTGEDETDAGEDEMDAGETEEGGELPEGLCAEVCANTNDEVCFPEQACLEICESEGPSWPPELYPIFEQCAQQNPLCFQTLENCMFSALHGDATHTVEVEGVGFEAYEGATISLWHDPQLPPFGGEAPIMGGGFAFEWDGAITSWEGESSLVLAHVDVDDDGQCGEGDIGGAFRPVWNGDWLEPVFRYTLAPEDLDNLDIACSFLP